MASTTSSSAASAPDDFNDITSMLISLLDSNGQVSVGLEGLEKSPEVPIALACSMFDAESIELIHVMAKEVEAKTDPKKKVGVVRALAGWLAYEYRAQVTKQYFADNAKTLGFSEGERKTLVSLFACRDWIQWLTGFCTKTPKGAYHGDYQIIPRDFVDNSLQTYLEKVQPKLRGQGIVPLPCPAALDKSHVKVALLGLTAGKISWLRDGHHVLRPHSGEKGTGFVWSAVKSIGIDFSRNEGTFCVLHALTHTASGFAVFENVVKAWAAAVPSRDASIYINALRPHVDVLFGSSPAAVRLQDRRLPLVIGPSATIRLVSFSPAKIRRFTNCIEVLSHMVSYYLLDSFPQKEGLVTAALEGKALAQDPFRYVDCATYLFGEKFAKEAPQWKDAALHANVAAYAKAMATKGLPLGSSMMYKKAALSADPLWQSLVGSVATHDPSERPDFNEWMSKMKQAPATMTKDVLAGLKELNLDGVYMALKRGSKRKLTEEEEEIAAKKAKEAEARAAERTGASAPGEDDGEVEAEGENPPDGEEEEDNQPMQS